MFPFVQYWACAATSNVSSEGATSVKTTTIFFCIEFVEMSDLNYV